jgi:integrase
VLTNRCQVGYRDQVPVRDFNKHRAKVTMAYKDYRVLRAGLVMFRLAESKGGVFRARIRLPKGSSKRHRTQTLRTNDEQLAAERAFDFFAEVQAIIKNGGDPAIPRATFSQVWARFRTTIKVNTNRAKYIDGTAQRYFLPFFGSRRLTDIGNRELAQYWEWRPGYWAEQEAAGVILPANVALVPSIKSLQMEATLLRQFLRWCDLTGYIGKSLKLENPSKGQPSVRRDTFSKEDHELISNCLLERADAPGINSRQRFERRMLRDLVQVLSLSGLRVGEAYDLRWRDVTFSEDEIVFLKVSPHRKTGMRQVVCLQGARQIFGRLQSYSPYTQQDDFVFPNYEGDRHKGYNKSFVSVLKSLGIRYDHFDKKRVLYSLRHFYATQMLLDDKPDAYFIAKNMGTGIKQLERHYGHVTSVDKARALSRLSKPELFRIYQRREPAPD